MVSAALLFLPGCFSAKIHMKVNTSGSAEIEVTMSAPRALMSLSATAGIFNNIKEDLSNDDFAIEDFEVDKQVGFTAVKKVSSVEEFSSLGLGDDLIISDEPIVTVNKHLLTNTYHIDTDLDLEKILGEELDATTRLADISFVLTLPVSPSEHNADGVSDNGKTLEWRLIPGSANPVKITATAPNSLLIVTIVTVAVLLVGGGIATAVMLVRRRKKVGKNTG